MRSYLEFVAFFLVAIFTIAFLAFVSDSMGFLSFKFFAPKVEQVRYDTFKNSQSFNDGMVRDLENLKMEYLRSNPEQKVALKAIVLHRFSVYPIAQLPADLQQFYYDVQR